MSNRSKARVYFLLGALAVSFVMALVATFAYGGLYAHERYWEGTRKRVAEKDAAVISGLLATPEMQAAFPRDEHQLSEIFRPLDGLLLIELRLRDSVVYSNGVANKMAGTLLATVPLGQGTLALEDDHVLTVSRYRTPTWPERFGYWLGHPGQWLGTSYNQITGPFFAFLIVFLLSSIALGWRARANHLEEEVLPRLGGGDANGR